MKLVKFLKVISYIIFIPILTFTNLSKKIVGILAVLILVDLLTGMIRELVVNGGRFLSRTLWMGIASKGLLILIPLIIAVVGIGIGIDMTMVAQLSLSALIVAEAYSTIGNIIQIRKNDKTIDEQDAVTMVIKSIESFLKSIIVSIISKFGEKK